MRKPIKGYGKNYLELTMKEIWPTEDISLEVHINSP